MKLRHSLLPILVCAIRRRTQAGSLPKRFKLLALRPQLLAEVAEEVEQLASQQGEYERLSAFDFDPDDENSLGFVEIIAFVFKHWDVIYPLLIAALALLPRVLQGEDES